MGAVWDAKFNVEVTSQKSFVQVASDIPARYGLFRSLHVAFALKITSSDLVVTATQL